MRSTTSLAFVVIAALGVLFSGSALMHLLSLGRSSAGGGTPSSHSHRLPPNPNASIDYTERELAEIYLAGGCFWGVEAYMKRLHGVAEVTVGYANGHTEYPTYEEVCSGQTGHAETVHVRYDPERTDLKTLLTAFFQIIDPTLENRQGNDIGTQYRTGIYYVEPSDRPLIEQVAASEQKRYDKPIVTEIEPLANYYLAEDYHQNYLEKNPGGYCHVDLSALPAACGLAPEYSRPDDAAIRDSLTPEQYRVTQQAQTERPFANTYWDHWEDGLYVDVVTGEPLFCSSAKFASGTGWPSFTQPLTPNALTYHSDTSHGMRRTEVRSQFGGSHLGHVFSDGPDGGQRYCINSAALRFIPKEELAEQGYAAYVQLCGF